MLGLGAIHLGAATLSDRGFPTTAILGAIVLWGGAWIVGDQLRQRRQRLADLIERAERAERETQRERRLAAAEERTRIARDLHDSAAHAINVILVQAGGARLLQDATPKPSACALITIEDVARETIGDIDQLIRGLRAERRWPGTRRGDRAADPGWPRPTRSPRATVRPDCRCRSASRAPRPLAPGLDQAAYRILQESLTNAARHGDGPAEVQIAYRERELELTVSNPLPAPPQRGPRGRARDPGDARTRGAARRHASKSRRGRRIASASTPACPTSSPANRRDERRAGPRPARR